MSTTIKAPTRRPATSPALANPTQPAGAAAWDACNFTSHIKRIGSGVVELHDDPLGRVFSVGEYSKAVALKAAMLGRPVRCICEQISKGTWEATLEAANAAGERQPPAHNQGETNAK